MVEDVSSDMPDRSVQCFILLMLGALLWPSLSLAVQQSRSAALPKEQELRQTVSRALNSLGIFYLRSKRSPGHGDSGGGTKYNPEDAGIRVNLAMVYLGQKQFEKVIAALGPDAKFGGHDQRSITAMAVSNFVLGKYDQAVFYYKKLSQLLPADQELLLTLAVVVPNGETQASQELLKKLPQDARTRAQYHVVLGDAYRIGPKVWRRSRSVRRSAHAQYPTCRESTINWVFFKANFTTTTRQSRPSSGNSASIRIAPTPTILWAPIT